MIKRILIWDLPTRLFHWCLALSVFYSWFCIEVLEDMQQHFYSGYVALTLLIFRSTWGVVGSAYSRFSTFPCSLSEILNYVKKNTTGAKRRYLGHNPLGSISVVLMIVVLLAQTILGLFSSDDYYFGPLTGLVDTDTIARISELHSLNSNVVFGLIGLHVVAIIYYKYVKKEALTLAMITGKKTLLDSSENEGSSAPRQASNFMALLILIICMALVYWLATAFLDRLPTSTENYY